MLRINGLILIVLFAVRSGALGQEVVRSGKVDSNVVHAVQPAATRELNVDELATYIETTRSVWQVPGLAVAVVHNDEVLLSRGFGVKQVDQSDSVNEHTLFAIASNSKAFTSAALAMLVDDGKLDWDDRVSHYLPWLRLKDPLASADLRVRDLLCHRSGLGTFSGDLLWWGTSYSPRQVLERAVELDAASPFRAKYGYSNLMFLAAGEVVEAASGKSWSEFVRDRILQPLAMNRTVTSVRDLVSVGNFATPHKTHPDHSEPLAWMNWDTMVSAGGIISSVHDMSHWLRLQLRQGELSSGSRLFSEKQSKTMWQAHTPIGISDKSREQYPSTHFKAYGLGWSLSDYRGRKIIGHGGGYDGMYSQVVMVPEEKLGIVVLTNSMTSVAPAITYHILDRVLAGEDNNWSEKLRPPFLKSRQAFLKRTESSITPVVEGTHPSHPLADYTGSFVCPMYGDAKVELENGGLVLKLLPNPELVADLEHLHYDTFVIHWRKQFAWFDEGIVNFIADSRGRFMRLELDVPNDDLWFYELKFGRVD